jgi:molybdenum cofactor synthesis domain-containing protein
MTSTAIAAIPVATAELTTGRTRSVLRTHPTIEVGSSSLCNAQRVKTAVITVSTSVAAGDTEDLSGRALAELAAEAGAEIVASEVVSDDEQAIEETLRRHVDSGAELIFTTGGTGLTPDDVTPEATRAVIDRDAPGFAEAMRAESLKHTPMGIVSRGVSGIAARTLIVNFPGNPKAIGELFPVIAPTLRHAVATLQRERGSRTPGH